MTKNRSLGFWATTYVCTALLGVALALTYVGLEQPVYYWDFAAYFDTFSRQGTLLIQSPLEWLSHLRTSIATDDYSAAILVPLMPFHIIFGDSRFSYIAGIVAVYLVPTALLIGRISYLEAATGTSSCRSWLTVWIAAFLYTPFWAATLRGLPDIAGCLALCAATYFLWKSRFLTHEPVISGIRVGVCLWLAFVLRRWHAYPVIGLGISAAFFCFLQVAKDRDFPALRNAAVGGLCAILVVVGAALTFQQPLIFKILGTSYGDLYSGYKTDFVSQIVQVGSRLSYVNWLLIVFGLYISIIRQNRFSLFCAVASALTFVLFTRMQDPDRHHSVPVFLWLFPTYAQAIVAIVSMPALRSRWSNAAIAVAAGLAFFGTFFPTGRQVLSPISYVFAREATLPLHLDNLPEYRRLIDDLLGKMGPGDRLSVFASSGIMSDSLLYEMDKDLYPRIEWACQVDSRDRFRPAALKSKYVVVTDPPVIHLQQGAQLCVSIPDQYIVEGKGIGAAYRRIAAYQLSGDVKGYLYEQVRPIGKTEVDDLYNEFRKKYPGWATPEW